MRKLIITLLLTVLCSAAFAQESNNGTLKFIGIPIDGPKEQLIEKIKAKGFRGSPYHEYLEGQFNGRNVQIYVKDNHGIAWRVFVAFPKTNAYRVRFEYNQLLNQFLQNDKYFPLEPFEEIPHDEDIPYEMTVHNKDYSAGFGFISPDVFSKEEVEKFREKFDSFQAIEEYIDLKEYLNDEDASNVLNMFGSLINSCVSFTILQASGEYLIGLYYDNLKNAPRGEDL